MSSDKDDEATGTHDAYAVDKEMGQRFMAAVFRYSAKTNPDVEDTLLETLKKYQMAPYYSSCAAEFDWDVDESLLASMTAANDAKIKELKEKLADAEENLGEAEVFDAAIALCDYLSEIGDESRLWDAFESAKAKAMSSGQKIDVELAILRKKS